MAKGNLSVHFDHQTVAEYPYDHGFSVASVVSDLFPMPPDGHPDDLVIFKREAGELIEVARHKHGSWHAGGHDIECGYVVDDSKCERCYPSASETSTNPAGT